MSLRGADDRQTYMWLAGNLEAIPLVTERAEHFAERRDAAFPSFIRTNRRLKREDSAIACCRWPIKPNKAISEAGMYIKSLAVWAGAAGPRH